MVGFGLLAILAMPAAAVAQTGSVPEPTPTIPGLVVSAPAAPAIPPPVSTIPGLYVAPPTAPTRPAPAVVPRTRQEPAAPDKPKRKPAPAKSASAAPTERGGTKIVALVNDEPITGFAVEQRARFMALSTNLGDRARENMKAIAQNPNTNERLKAILQETINANPGKSREQVIAAFETRKKAFVTSLQKQAIEGARAGVMPTLRKQALQELIDERLKLQEARKLTVKVGEADVEKILENMAKRNKMTSAQFAEHIARQGGDANVIKTRLRASLAWREVVRKRYGHQINVSQQDVERFAAKAGGEESVELKLQLITLATTGAVDQRAMAARLTEANELRTQFKGCSSMAGLAKGRPNAKFQDLGFKKPSSLVEPTQSLLLSAKDGEILPANLSASGVEIYAVCGRRSGTLDEEKRQAVESQLTTQEFEKLAQRYLHDLRKDALIETR